MIGALSGIGGSLLPGRFLAEKFCGGAGDWLSTQDLDATRRRFAAWWAMVAATCGPATGQRALFDLVAMPLFGRLGFRATAVRFDRNRARVQLETPRAAVVGLILLPWALRPTSLWRAASEAGRALGANWCFVLAPPFLSLVDARGCALRRSLEFSLPQALDAGSFAAFLSVCHASAFEHAAAAAGRPPSASHHDAPLDALVRAGVVFHDRIREDLQIGVLDALEALTRALPGSRRPAGGADRFEEALTLVYRVLFLLFAEARDLVPRRHPVYRGAYAIETLCREALQAQPAAGLWEGLAAVTRLSRAGCRVDDLIVRPFNGRLFARGAAPALEAPRPARRSSRGALDRDAALRTALVALATRPGPRGREDISYADLGVEQLGAVYERVLDVDPSAVVDAPDPAGLARTAARRRARPTSRHSARRKQSGTFYTPQALADYVVRRTLAPLVSGAAPEDILALRVLDPAMGSGAFLVSACRFLARAYERALVEEGRCAETDLDEDAHADIRRRIAERCLTGVDVNPIAVQVARLSLWLTTLARGKPLSFLDHRLRTGNSLIGASPEELRHVAGARRAGAGQSLPLFADVDLEERMRLTARPLAELGTRRDDTVADVHAKDAIWRQLSSDRSPVGPWRLAASLWVARWFWPRDDASGPPPSPAEMRAAIDAILKGDTTLRAAPLGRWLAVARSLQAALGFFHWPLEFADVFYDDTGRPRSRPGFDAVIGNPPWEMLRGAEPRNHRTAEPRNLGTPEPRSALVRFIRKSGLYPSCDRGHVNLYQPFLERALSLARPGGRVGLVVPFGLATDDGAAGLRAQLLDRAATETIVGLDNAQGLFPIHRGVRFLAVVARAGGTSREIRARFGVSSREDLDALPDGCDDSLEGDAAYPVRLTPQQLRLVGGPTRRIPDVRRPEELVLLERLMREYPPLGSAEGWAARFGRELNATDDRAAFGRHGLPIIEGKHIQPFAVNLSGAQHHIDPRDAGRLLPARGFDRARLAYRDVSGVGNRLSLIGALVPARVVTTHTLFCLRQPLAIERQHYLCGLFNSYVLNAIVRMLMGGHLTTSLVESLPVPAWRDTEDERQLARLARALSERPASPASHARLQMTAARLYGLGVEEFRRVLEGFPLVPRADRLLALDLLAGRRAVE